MRVVFGDFFAMTLCKVDETCSVCDYWFISGFGGCMLKANGSERMEIYSTYQMHKNWIFLSFIDALILYFKIRSINIIINAK